MIEASVLRAMLAAGATAEMIVVAVEAMLAQDAARREKNALRQSRYRALRNATKKKGPHTPKEKTITPESYKNNSLPPENPLFEEFWEIYPRKVGKGAARKAFRHAAGRADCRAIIDGARRYAATKPDPQYTKHPQTWLNADCWLDEGPKVVPFEPIGPKRTWAEIKAERDEASGKA